MNILAWNARGLSSEKKTTSLHNIIKDYHIDIIAIQETKKEDFTKRELDSIWTGFDEWIVKPSRGLSGGILIGLDSSKFIIEKSSIQKYSITIWIQNRIDSFKWMLTVVYGPIDKKLKNEFWAELRDIGITCTSAWVLCGDFNALRFRREKLVTIFNLELVGNLIL